MLQMVTGRKRYFSVNSGGKWFAHPTSPGNETRNRETCTSTGIMLTQVKSALPQAFNSERYPKWRTQQESRNFPFSCHDNKHILKHDISVFDHGVGRRKCLGDHKQQKSHFCLCHDAAESSTEKNISLYQTDFRDRQTATSGPASTRHFPRNHQVKSAEAALAQAGEQFMWFGQIDSESDLRPKLPTTQHPRSAKMPCT